MLTKNKFFLVLGLSFLSFCAILSLNYSTSIKRSSNTEKIFSKKFQNSNSNILEVLNGDFGEWPKEMVRWPQHPDSFPCGAAVRFQGRQARGDDTAMNGLKFVVCKHSSWSTQATVTIHAGLFGEWSPVEMCPEGTFIEGLKVRHEDKIGGDNTQMNGLKFKCKKSGWKTAHEGIWGNWKDDVNFDGRNICGAKIKFQKESETDKTGATGLAVELCPLPVAPVAPVLPVAPPLPVELAKIEFDWSTQTRTVLNVMNSSWEESNSNSKSKRMEWIYWFFWTENSTFVLSNSSANIKEIIVTKNSTVNFKGSAPTQRINFGDYLFNNVEKIVFNSYKTRPVSSYRQGTTVVDRCTKKTLNASADNSLQTLKFKMTLLRGKEEFVEEGVYHITGWTSGTQKSKFSSTKIC